MELKALEEGFALVGITDQLIAQDVTQASGILAQYVNCSTVYPDPELTEPKMVWESY